MSVKIRGNQMKKAYITTLEIARVLNRPHDRVLIATRRAYDDFGFSKETRRSFNRTYMNSNNLRCPYYNLPREVAENVIARTRYINVIDALNQIDCLPIREKVYRQELLPNAFGSPALKESVKDIVSASNVLAITSVVLAIIAIILLFVSYTSIWEAL